MRIKIRLTGFKILLETQNTTQDTQLSDDRYW